MKNRIQVLLLAGMMYIGLVSGQPVFAHCEIPCGIYGDRMRVEMLKEHFHTVETSMRAIKEIERAGNSDANQLVRWVVNKEEHAKEIQEIVHQYFMTQRIEPVEKSDGEEFEIYVTQITLLHRMLIRSMKCKQTTDEAHIEKLRSLLAAFEKAYFKSKDHDHHHH